MTDAPKTPAPPDSPLETAIFDLMSAAFTLFALLLGLALAGGAVAAGVWCVLRVLSHV